MEKFPQGTGIFFVDVDKNNNVLTKDAYNKIIEAFKQGALPVMRRQDPVQVDMFYIHVLSIIDFDGENWQEFQGEHRINPDNTYSF